MEAVSNSVVDIQGLEFCYGKTKVLDGVTLTVPKGAIFGFLGRNGAGKTTTIKTLLGLQKPSGGRCAILGMDVVKDSLAIRRRIGYMAEDQQMYGWMTVEKIMKWVGRFYPNWDAAFTKELAEMLELPLKTKVKHLSKGQNSRLALLLALGHRPELVILDDPTLGLDPIARKDFLRHVIGLLQSNGVTVLFSSHLLYEIEPVADRIAILEGGRIVLSEETDRLRETMVRVIVEEKDVDYAAMEGVLKVDPGRGHVVLTGDNEGGKMTEHLKRSGVTVMQELGVNLDEIFEAYVLRKL